MGSTNTLEIIIKAKSGQAITEIKKLDQAIGPRGALGKSVDGLKAKFQSTISYLSSPQGMAMIGTAIGGVIAVMGTLTSKAKEFADEFMNYALQVSDFGRIIGATPEEASKLIQVADDVRLSVESMTIAMRSAITKGYSPSIAALGQMSDAYLAIQDPIERSRFLIETFGRSGLEMAKLMELGSKKINEMGDSIEGTARLMTAEGVKAAKEYYAALDTLNDRTMDLKYAIGKELIPALADLINWFNTLVDTGPEVENFLRLIILSISPFAYLIKLFKEATDETNRLEAAYGKLPDSIQGAIDAIPTELSGPEVTIPDIDPPKLKSPIEARLEWKIPDVTSQLKTLFDKINFESAGGTAFMMWWEGFKSKLLTAGQNVQEVLDPLIASVELGIKVDAEIINKEAAIQRLVDDFKISYGEAKLMVEAALELKPGSVEALQGFINMQLLKKGIGLVFPVTAEYVEPPEGVPDLQPQVEDMSLPNLEKSLSIAEGTIKSMVTEYAKIKDKSITVKVNYVTSGATTPGLPPGTPGGAAGASFVVPPGYPADSYLFRLTSGEKVTVENRAQQGKREPALNQYITLQAVEPMDFRALARQVARELAGAGVR